MSIRSASFVGETALATDVAIIGAGPAGLSLAAKLNRDCMVIESGSLTTDVRTHHVFHSINTGEPSKIDAVRVRGVGGASLRWTGRCIPLDRYDFEDRPWISETGWPISYDEMLEWSESAAQLMQLPAISNDCVDAALADQAEKFGSFIPAIWSFAEDNVKGILRFGDHLRDAFNDANRHILYEAHCVEIMGNAQAVKAVRVMDRTGRSFLVKANHFVIAGGCVETCRMLLAARRTNPELLGEVAGWLGRGFHQHLRLDAGKIIADTRQLGRLQSAFDIHRYQGAALCETGLSFNPAFAREKQLGNASLVLRYEPQRGLSPLDWFGSVKSRLTGKTVRHRKARVLVEIDSEQAVDHASFVGLADENDPLGQPRARVHWKINPVDCETAYAAMCSFASFVEEHGLGHMKQANGITPDAVDICCRRDSLHQLGGTRMSANAKTGVVDADLKVHGTANLSVVGGSVFATGGHANPTQTIVALAMRLAAHLNGSVDRPAAQSSSGSSDTSLSV
ncbi:MAG: GMC family oxidoreductase [Pseudomonadota bacterium]